MLIYKDGKPDYKNENIERENLKNMLNNQFYKPMIVDDMDRFEKRNKENKTKKQRLKIRLKNLGMIG